MYLQRLNRLWNHRYNHLLLQMMGRQFLIYWLQLNVFREKELARNGSAWTQHPFEFVLQFNCRQLHLLNSVLPHATQRHHLLLFQDIACGHEPG